MPTTEGPPPGSVVELEVGPPAHGGHCVARLAGRVVFVRHTLPGEVVRAVLTETGGGRSYWRADAVEILSPSPDRVPSAWPEAGPGGVGGGELAHVALPAQRRWKTAVVAESLRRIGGVDREVEVAAVPGDDARGGLAYRTRIELTADHRGRAGMFRHRTHDVRALTRMPLAAVPITDLGLLDRPWRPGARIDAIAPVGGDRPLVLVDGVPLRGERRSVREVVDVAGESLTFRVSGSGFWQVHDGAPRLLVRAVLAACGLGPDARPGVPRPRAVLDLYAGAGLFTVPLARAVGSPVPVAAVEADARAVRDARRNVHALGNVTLYEGAVGPLLSGEVPLRSGEVVVLDPPRTGAGAAVMGAVVDRRPARIVYVACDPAALGRDVRAAGDRGYALRDLRAFDLFPHTHHVECVAILEPA